MKYQKIHFDATHSNWRLFMVRKTDPGFKKFEAKVFERDAYTCQFCGFRAKEYMDVININGNFRDNKLSNLATACPFCAQPCFLESMGRDEFGGGVLIILPEMTQGALNALCHVLFTSIVSGSASATQARNIYRSFKLRSQQAEKILGEGMSNPSLLGRLLVDSGEGNAKKMKSNLEKNVRVLPDLQRFASPVKSWINSSLTMLGSLS